MANYLFRLMVLIFIGLIGLPCGQAPDAYADEIRSENIQIPEGESGVTLTGRISGYEIIDYKVYGCESQEMIIVLETDNTANYFNIMAPGESEVAMFIGSIEGNRFNGSLPDNGEYTVRVYLMRSAARRGEIARYSLAINVAGSRTICSLPHGTL